MTDDELEFVDEEDAALEASETASFSEAVLYSSDWTVETVISQLKNQNIEMNPRFQRRDAWSPGGKGRFIESVILNFPIPQIVLAEKKGHRGQFIVLEARGSVAHTSGAAQKAVDPKDEFKIVTDILISLEGIDLEFDRLLSASKAPVAA